MKLAAIDIGSNAARLYVANIIISEGIVKYKKIHYMRYPLRLGKDVFKNGEISKPKLNEFLEFVAVLKSILKLYKIDGYLAYATSAMREASNGQEIADLIFQKTKFKIELIEGEMEALFLANALENNIDKDKNALHIDVGGGSTELNLYKQGVKIQSESFKIGSVRDLTAENSLQEIGRMKSWIETMSKGIKLHYAIGTGGNIRKLQKLSFYGTNEPIELERLIETKERIEPYSLEDRIEKLMLNADRADVIIPAAELYIMVMQKANVNLIEVPDIGLKDGIMLAAYQNALAL